MGMADRMQMAVKEVATAAGVTSDAVRYYARIGLLRSKRNPVNGFRKFSNADIHRLRFIARAKKIGFTLSEINQGESPWKA